MSSTGDAARPYTLVDDRLWFVDTGASRTTCDDDFVASLGVEARPTWLRAHGEVGSVPIRRAVLRDVTIGGWTFRRLPCAVRDLATTSSLPDDPDEPVVGILGANLFGRFVLDLDFAERRMRLRTDAPALEEGVRVRRERLVGPRLVAALDVDGERVDVVVDTGADRTYLPLETGEEVARYAAERQGTGPGGAAPVEVVVRRVERATLDERPLPLDAYVHRRGRPGLLGMDALGMARVVVDGPGRHLAWAPGEAPRFLTPDEARRAAREADGSEAGRAALAEWEMAHGDPDRAVDLYARLGDAHGYARALMLAGRWEEGRSAALSLGGTYARVVAMVEDGVGYAPESAMAVFGPVIRAPTLGQRLLAVRRGEGAVGVGVGAGRAGADLPAAGGAATSQGGPAVPGEAAPRGGRAEAHEAVLAALIAEREAPGAAAVACAQLPAARDAEEVMLLVACGQRERATEALAGLAPGAVRPPGMTTARARAAWLDARALLAVAEGDPAAALEALELAVRTSPWDAYLHARRAEVRALVGE